MIGLCAGCRGKRRGHRFSMNPEKATGYLVRAGPFACPGTGSVAFSGFKVKNAFAPLNPGSGRDSQARKMIKLLGFLEGEFERISHHLAGDLERISRQDSLIVHLRFLSHHVEDD